jgi:hypothetical protein
LPLDSWKNYTANLDTRRVPGDVVAELLRQAEMRQEAIFRAALGMDQRASILAGGFAAAAGAIAAAALTLASSPATLQIPALIAAAFLAIAAGLCAFACRPQPFRFPGNPPNDWARDPQYMEDNSLSEILLAHAARLEDWMHSNELRQHQNGRLLTWGLLSASAGPVIAAGFFLFVNHLSWIVSKVA